MAQAVDYVQRIIIFSVECQSHQTISYHLVMTVHPDRRPDHCSIPWTLNYNINEF